MARPWHLAVSSTRSKATPGILVLDRDPAFHVFHLGFDAIVSKVDAEVASYRNAGRFEAREPYPVPFTARMQGFYI